MMESERNDDNVERKVVAKNQRRHRALIQIPKMDEYRNLEDDQILYNEDE